MNKCNKYLSLLFITFLIISVSHSFSQNQVRCYYCKEIIKTKYIIVEGKSFHPEHFLCKFCGKQINGSYNSKGGDYYHPDCFAQSEGLICFYCKKVLNDEYIIHENKKYHKTCYENFIIPKCAVCGQPLKSSFFEDTFHNRYHSYHRNELNLCDCCNRIICESITGGGKTYSDGRHICNLCYSTAVFDQSQIGKLLYKVADRISSFGINLNLKNTKIIGVNRNELRNKAKNYSEGTQGYCNSETLNKYINNKLTDQIISHTIYVLNGVPILNLESTIAHELMHSWIYENAKKNLPERIVEGSCNFIAYLYLKSLRKNSADDLIRLMENDSDINYGKGFLEIRDKFADKSINEFLLYLKK